jgi:hypothetical protein
MKSMQYYVKNASEYKLPKRGVTINYIIAKEDYYFVYPTDYHKFLTHYKDTFQHGGISLEEMILPHYNYGTKIKCQFPLFTTSVNLKRKQNL